MHVPTEDELAAIAAAYVAVTRASEPPAHAGVAGNRWQLASRLESVGEGADVVATAHGASRWRLAGRVDG